MGTYVLTLLAASMATSAAKARAMAKANTMEAMVTTKAVWAIAQVTIGPCALNVFGLFISIGNIWQSIDPWPSIICNIQPGIIPSSSEYDLILFPFVIVFKY